MKLIRLAAPVVAASLVFSGIAAPQAQAYSTTYDQTTGTCTITFTEQDQKRVNDAYRALFLRLAEETRESFVGEKPRSDAKIVWEYGTREDVKRASDLPLPANLTISNAQSALALGGQKDKYWEMVGFINASKKPVVSEPVITMTPEQARKDGGVTYGVSLADALAGTIGGVLLGGDTEKLRDRVLTAATTYAPEFGAPILSYGRAFDACADRKESSSSILPGSALTSSQAAGIGVAGLVAGILALVGISFALRPFVGQLSS